MKLKNISLLTLFLVVPIAIATAQDNLLDTSSWTVGTGSSNGFSIYGGFDENERLLGINPHMDNVVLWAATPNGNGSSDGGVYSPYVNVDSNKTYRLSVWIKKTGSQVGTSYFGLHITDSQGQQAAQEFVSNSINSNPYFFLGQNFPELDKWYLLVAYVHPNTYSGNSLAKVYDGETGQEISSLNIYDYKFGPGAISIRNRALLWQDVNVGDKQYYWNPAIYEVNGQEPSITEMINPNSTTEPDNGSTTSVWSETNSVASYTGKVGIGTTATGNYELAVNGEIRAKEIKVEIANWPDYVFAKNYTLPTLEEVENHIQEKGHLKNIPSAAEVEANGIELGNMNKLLLEKIEELTLYIIQLKKENDLQQEQINKLIIK
jgi:hypothetical protein